MFYQVQLWKGLTSPYVNAHQLNKAEKYSGIWKWMSLLLLFTLILSGISAYNGIGNEQLSKLIYDTGTSEFHTIKGLFALGQVIQAIIVMLILIFFPALILWVFTDIEYQKLVVVQLYIAGIYIIEKIVTIPLQFYFGLSFESSPFAFGIITHYLTDYEIIIKFFGEISLFSIWAIVLQFKFLTIITQKSPKIIVLLIISINLFIWLFTAMFSFIKFETMF